MCGPPAKASTRGQSPEVCARLPGRLRQAFDCASSSLILCRVCVSEAIADQALYAHAFRVRACILRPSQLYSGGGHRSVGARSSRELKSTTMDARSAASALLVLLGARSGPSDRVLLASDASTRVAAATLAAAAALLAAGATAAVVAAAARVGAAAASVAAAARVLASDASSTAAGARGVSPARAAPTAAAQEEAPASSSPPTAPEVASEAGECSEAETPSVPPLTPGGASTAFGSPFTRCARASKPTRLLFGLCTPCRRFTLRKAQNIYATQKVADTKTHLLR